MNLIITDASLRRSICGVGVILVNEYGVTIDQFQTVLIENVAYAWEAKLHAVRLGIQQFGHLSHIIYSDSKSAVDAAAMKPWRTSQHCVWWLSHHLRRKYHHAIVRNLADEARRHR